MSIALLSLVPSLAVAPAPSVSAAAAELRSLLVEAAASRSDVDAARADALVAELAAARVPFDAALLGATDAVPSGLWRASYTAGAPPPIVDARTGEAISDIPGRTMVAATVVLERLWSVEDGSYAGYLRIVHAKVYRPPSTIVYT